MSLATRWGDHLFPGITVLTRDLHDIKAIHETAVGMDVANSPRRLYEFQRPTSDLRIARELSKILSRERIRVPSKNLTQQMTYWQRYGSLMDHFGLMSQKRPKTVDGYREMIFEGPTGPAKDGPAIRKRRIMHFKWYRRNRKNLLAIQTTDIAQLFRGETGAWRRWWLTGLKPPANVPAAICLVRELEFFFTVWQTLFEISAFLLHQTGRADASRGRSSRPLEDFLTLIVSFPGNGRSDWQKLASICLQLHENFISLRLPKWQKSAINLIGPHKNFDGFTKLHNNKDIETFGARDSSEMPEALAELHVAYCELQNNRHAVRAWSFKRPKPGPSFPTLSADFTHYRWGLFGYRFEASLTLRESLKYFSLAR
jgi:hypothetical protein